MSALLLAELELENDSDTEDAVSDKKSSEKKDKTKEYKIDEYGLADYDDEQETPEGGSKLLGLGDLTAFTDPREDPYLSQLDKDVGAEDEEDFNIRSTDNLILAGHVDGDSSTLEIYIYNDVEDALYVHHDILLQSFSLALEWISYDPENDKKGSLVADGADC